jgi:dsDNA-specific endonuclease/ATPase MutS2
MAHFRQKEALRAERERLQTQLGHDRKLKDLDGLRTLLNDCLTWILQMTNDVMDATAVLLDKAEPLSQDESDELEKRVEVCWQTLNASMPLEGRLLSHVEDTSDLYGEFNRYLAAEEAIIQSMSDEGHPTQKASQKHDEQGEVLRAASLSFRAEARRLAAFAVGEAPGGSRTTG